MKNFFLRYKSPIAVIMALLIAGGVLFYTRIETSLLPEITFPKIKVIVDDGEQPVDKMMLTITKPLENILKKIPDLQRIRSTTSRGSCEISIFLDWNANVETSRQQAESYINQIRSDLPAGTQIKVEKMSPSTAPVMGYTVESANKSPIELRLIAEHLIKPYLSQVVGISSIEVSGGKTKEYWIELHAQKMSALGITPAMINDALNATNFIKSNGYTNDYRRLYLTLTDAGIYTKDELENVVLRNDGKRIVTLKDIATEEIQQKIEYIKINANSKEAILVDILKQPKANLIDLANQLRAKVNELQKMLPEDVKLVPYYDQSDFVTDAVKSVSDSLWLGLVLAILVVFIFLRSLKASLTVLVTIPITLALSFTVVYAMHYTLNIITLGAIAASIGLIIDDAIVVMEQIFRVSEEHPNEAPSSVVNKAVRYILPSMISSSISTIVIFIPFEMMTGIAGAYFKVLTNTMIITLICSFFVTWICLPVVYLIFARKKERSKNNFSEALPHPIKKQKWISFFIKRPIISLAIIVGLIFAVWLILPKLETGFLPQMDEGTIAMDYSSPPGTSLQQTDSMLCQVEKKILAIPEVESYARRTGTQMGFFITEPNTGDYLIQLKKKRKRTTDQVIDAIRQTIESSQPALRVDFGQRIEDILGDLMSSTQPIEIKIFGSDPAYLNQTASVVAGLVTKVKGTADVFDGVVIAGPNIEIKPNFIKLAQYQITPSDFQFQMETQLKGSVVGQIMEKQQMTDIRMVYPDNKDATVQHIKNEFIFLPDGKLKPIGELANVQIQSGVAEIQRENNQSVALVTARLDNRDLGSVIKDIKKQIAENIHLPQGYSITYGGSYQQQQQSFLELLQILFTASLLVFTVILFLYRDFKVALLILFIALLGDAGSLLALYITHTPLNVGSYTGLIMIVGIIGENAIFTFQQFQDSLQTNSVDDALVYSISTRLRPKLMTAIGAIIALLPLAMGIGTGAQLHQPLAIAVIGGFTIALPLLLIIFPSLLRLLYRKHNNSSSYQ